MFGLRYPNVVVDELFVVFQNLIVLVLALLTSLLQCVLGLRLPALKFTDLFLQLAARRHQRLKVELLF